MTHPLNSDGDTIAALADELANAKVHHLYEMPIVTVTLSKTNLEAIVAALRDSARPSALDEVRKEIEAIPSGKTVLGFEVIKRSDALAIIDKITEHRK